MSLTTGGSFIHHPLKRRLQRYKLHQPNATKILTHDFIIIRPNFSSWHCNVVVFSNMAAIHSCRFLQDKQLNISIDGHMKKTFAEILLLSFQAHKLKKNIYQTFFRSCLLNLVPLEAQFKSSEWTKKLSCGLKEQHSPHTGACNCFIWKTI